MFHLFLFFLEERDAGEMKELTTAGEGGGTVLDLLLRIKFWARDCSGMWGMYSWPVLRGQIELR